MQKLFCPSWVFALTLICVLALGVREFSLLPDGKLHVHFLDVGQGDSIFLVSPSGSQILIDGGPDLSTLEHLGKFMSFFDRNIDLLVLTHPNADHLTALPAVLKRYQVKQMLLSGVQYSLPRYEEILNLLKNQNITLLLPDNTKDISFGDGLVLDIVWPPAGNLGASTKNINDSSIVIRALFDEHRVLLTGDIERGTESLILAAGLDLSATIMQAPHHGSKTSSSTGFILAADPEEVIISVSSHNSYGHPHKLILDRYQNLGVPVRSTANEGTISFALERGKSP
jgi:competence protein ComEC